MNRSTAQSFWKRYRIMILFHALSWPPGLMLAKPFDFNISISTNNWSQGIYLWEIWNGTQKEAFGKWIKE